MGNCFDFVGCHHCSLHPGDLFPFTRKPLFIIVDSSNSASFKVDRLLCSLHTSGPCHYVLCCCYASILPTSGVCTASPSAFGVSIFCRPLSLSCCWTKSPIFKLLWCQSDYCYILKHASLQWQKVIVGLDPLLNFAIFSFFLAELYKSVRSASCVPPLTCSVSQECPRWVCDNIMTCSCSNVVEPAGATKQLHMPESFKALDLVWANLWNFEGVDVVWCTA